MVDSSHIQKFSFSSLVADADGLLSTYSSYTINGTIQSVAFLDNSFDDTGSIMLFESGTEDLIISAQATSRNTTVSPYVYGTDPEGTTGSPYAILQRVILSPLQIVLSGVGANTSGGVTVTYY